jgi:hypothetical protein
MSEEQDQKQPYDYLAEASQFENDDAFNQDFF